MKHNEEEFYPEQRELRFRIVRLPLENHGKKAELARDKVESKKLKRRIKDWLINLYVNKAKKELPLRVEIDDLPENV